MAEFIPIRHLLPTGAFWVHAVVSLSFFVASVILIGADLKTNLNGFSVGDRWALKMLNPFVSFAA